MSARTDLSRVRAPESIRKGRVTQATAAEWPKTLRTIRTCFHCKTVYEHGGYAYLCEHWHEGT